MKILGSFSVKNCNSNENEKCIIQGRALQKYLKVYARYFLIFLYERTVEELLHTRDI